jgi:hypothetical protein
MIGWVTDNSLSSTVMKAIPGVEKRHIREFGNHVDENGIELLYKQNLFYGLLRGCSRAMHIIAQTRSANYFYIDNGYFDAQYVDKSYFKSMEGTFRVVKNGMHEVFTGNVGTEYQPKNLLIIPPSTYSANFYDTTPEDWLASMPFKGRIRTKDSKFLLKDELEECDAVLSFNSMIVLKAIEMGKAIMDTHGMFRRPTFNHYDYDEIRAFYEPKQFTLQEFSEGKCAFI